MRKNINISISGINSESINKLENKYARNIKITNINEHTVNLNILDSYSDEFLLLTIENFLSTLESSKVYNLTPSHIFDEANSMIMGPISKEELTCKEVMFLKMLLLTNKIVTYTQMMNLLWKDQSEVSQNAVRVFVKNLKKKLPSDILKIFKTLDINWYYKKLY